MKPRSIIEKIWDAHIVKQISGGPVILSIDVHFIHEITSAQAFDVLRQRKLSVFEPEKCIATIDHAVPTRANRKTYNDDLALMQTETLRKNCQEFGISLFDLDSGKQGIVHVIGQELGLTHPGMTIVCGDSHTSTHGAFGALAFGIGTTEVSHVLATGCIIQKPSNTMRVSFDGRFTKGIYAKDAILALIGKIGIAGANHHIIEYVGEVIRNMTMEERMTICNMSIECGAKAGLIAPDETTFEYLKNRQYVPKDFEYACSMWSRLKSDTDAEFNKEIGIDVSSLEPMITWGINPEMVIPITGVIPQTNDNYTYQKALDYVKLESNQKIEGIPIQWAFLGSCTNARIEDLRIASKILKGQKVSSGVTMFIVPGSEAVREQALREGLDEIFISAGADFRMPGCSMCLAMNEDKVPSGKRCISSSNRNFIGRQGRGSITHLASPATVAASAIEGKIADARKYI